MARKRTLDFYSVSVARTGGDILAGARDGEAYARQFFPGTKFFPSALAEMRKQRVSKISLRSNPSALQT
jgi:hypothetical protein